MKKLIAVFGVLLFSASAFALNAEAQADEKCPGAAEFAKVAQQPNNYFIAQHILINLADPLETMDAKEAQEVVQCYASPEYNVKGQPLAAFVARESRNFRETEANQLLAFATRLTDARLAWINSRGTTDNVMEFILLNLADPMKDLSDAQAAPLAKVYSQVRVRNTSLVEFVNANSGGYPQSTSLEFDAFTNRIERLAK